MPTITADTGSFALAGQDVNLMVGSPLTGEGRFTVSFLRPASGIFPAVAPTRYQLGMQCLFRSWGVGADQVNRPYGATLTFSPSVAQEIDMFALIGARVRILQIKFGPGTDPAAWLKLGGAAVNPWLPIGDLTIYPGTTLNHGGLILTAPAPIGIPASPTSRMLKMLPSAHAFSVLFLGLGSSV